MKNNKWLTAVVAVGLLVFLPQTLLAAKDVRGAKDHRLLERFPGATISKYLEQNLAQYAYATGPAVKKEVPVSLVEGKLTALVYKMPKQASQHEVFARYLAAFDQLGAVEAFSCQQQACGKNFANNLFIQKNQNSLPTVDVYNLKSKASSSTRLRYWAGSIAATAKQQPVHFALLSHYRAGQSWSLQFQVIEQTDAAIQPLKTNLAALSKLNNVQSKWAKLKQKDINGAADHELIARFPGSVIEDYLQNDFSDYAIAKAAAGKKKLPTIDVEGKVTAIIYKLPKNITSYEILKNHQSTLLQQGFKEIYSCRQQHCGHYLAKKLFVEKNHKKFPIVDVYNMKPKADTPAKFSYWSGVLEREQGNVYITLMTDYYPGVNSRYQLHIVESGSMKMDQITVSLDGMKNSIAQQGKVVLAGLYFDHDKAQLKSESDVALAVITDYLKKHPQQNGYVVGHTDIKGSLNYNQSLSKRRAMAVVDALVKRGVVRQRIQPMGVGPLSPSLSNKQQSGRSKNRRVELVIKEI